MVWNLGSGDPCISTRGTRVTRETFIASSERIYCCKTSMTTYLDPQQGLLYYLDLGFTHYTFLKALLLQ